MRFLVDIGVGKRVESFLKEKEYDIASVRNINTRLTDFEILKLATSEKRTVVTMDKDFGELAFNSGYEHTGILLLRLEDMNGDRKAEIVRYILENFASRFRIIFAFSTEEDFEFALNSFFRISPPFEMSLH